MNIYHVFIEPEKEEPFMIALAIYSIDQALLIGSAFPVIAKIETWDGDAVYTKRTVH
jgi:hypothetical protein